MNETSKSRLSEKKYWDAKYGVSRSLALKLAIKKLLRIGPFKYLNRYCNYLIWEIIYPKYLPKDSNLKVLEVGSAPGERLVRLNQAFGYVPYGVEYSESGVEMNREVFRRNNLDPDNVLHHDFFSEQFQEQYRGKFDIVVSNGFIEHFKDPKDTVTKHVNLLSKGGYLVVEIPNLRGMNYILTRFFNREIIPIHNLDIMDLERFRELFTDQRLVSLFCGYYGTFNFGLFFTKKHSLRWILLMFFQVSQFPLNLVFRLLFRSKGRECKWFSPSLLYIGQTKGKIE